MTFLDDAARATHFEAAWREAFRQLREALDRSELNTGEVRAAIREAENVMREATALVRRGDV